MSPTDEYADATAMRIIADDATATFLADGDKFTGCVWRTDYIVGDHDHLSGVRFLYEPGARSYWHVHEQEQAIIAVHGVGLVAWEGLTAPRRLRPGDWWHVAPGVAHWHGATPEAAFCHMAVNAGGATIWQHEVTDDRYRAAPA